MFGSRKQRDDQPSRFRCTFGGLLVIVICAALISAGCGGGGGSSSSSGSSNGTIAAPTAADLVGHWIQTSIAGSGPFVQDSSPCPGSVLGVASCGSNDNIQFNSDGTFVHQFADRTAGSKSIEIERGTFVSSADPAESSDSLLTLNVTAGGADTNGNGILDASEVSPNSAHVTSGSVTIENSVLQFDFSQTIFPPGGISETGIPFTEFDDYKKQ